MTSTEKSLENVLRTIGFDSVEQIGSLVKVEVNPAARRVLQTLWMTAGEIEDGFRREASELVQLAARVAEQTTNLETGMRTTADWVVQSAQRVAEVDAQLKRNIDKAIELTALYRLF